MAIGDAYATPGEYRALKDKTVTEDDVMLARQLLATSRYLDRKLNQPLGFNKDAAVTTRDYGRYDVIAPIASTAGLIVKASSGHPITWASVTALTLDSDYELLPRNAIADGKPFTSILFHGAWNTDPIIWSPGDYFLSGDYRVRVTAIHGWPAVPEAIWWATIELTAILRAESIFTTNRIQEFDTAVEASPQSRAILRELFEKYNLHPVAIG